MEEVPIALLNYLMTGSIPLATIDPPVTRITSIYSFNGGGLTLFTVISSNTTASQVTVYPDRSYRADVTSIEIMGPVFPPGEGAGR